ncbi:MAG: integrase arm-type DNA-binding domain-containing protein [Gammaproteobacteria bacterium]|nr:integrase arm-type DNA-binding domain-containing protein [Gammaproteobacteria bacterium]
MSKRIPFTKKALEQLTPASDEKRRYIYDTKVNGLCISITPTGVKSFIVYRKVKGKPVRVTLGRFPSMTIEQARKKALETLSKFSEGINPIEEKREVEVSNITLKEVFDDYLKARKNLKPGTILDYHKSLQQTFSDWLDKPLRAITKDMAIKRHAQRGNESPARANNAFRVLRALFNFARFHYEDSQNKSLFLENPVVRLSATKSWFKVKRKQSYIKRTELPIWFNTVISLENEFSFAKTEIVKDYLLFILFTGVRREEAAGLKWSDVDLKEGTFMLADTKNSESVTLPMSSFVTQLLRKRKLQTESIFVFPGEGCTGHLVEPRKQILRIRKKSGIEFTVHDLRRTFATITESLDMSRYTLKRLLNHKINDDADVTAGYIISDQHRLKLATQKITDHILQLVGYEQDTAPLFSNNQVTIQPLDANVHFWPNFNEK